MNLKQIIIHTDGGCSGNPGIGGWAAVLRYGDKVKEISGGEIATTNNRMELRAAIEALRALKERCEVTLFTDSEYLRNGITSWIRGWKYQGWRTKEKECRRGAEGRMASAPAEGVSHRLRKTFWLTCKSVQTREINGLQRLK